MIDLHSHLLPGVDDGSRSVEQSVKVLEAMKAAGVTAVCLTPHHTAGKVAGGIPATHDAAFAALSAKAPKGIALHRGVELMLDRPVNPDLKDRPGLTLGGTRFILVEFTRLVSVPAATNALQQVSHLGLVPVLAHPERYSACTPAAARQWKAAGAVLQVDATTLIRGRSRAERARALLAHGLADIMAADNHGDERSIAAAHQFLLDQGADVSAELLSTTNPAAILANGELEAVPPFEIRTGFMGRLRQMFGGGDE